MSNIQLPNLSDNLDKFYSGDEIEITLKLNGYSQFTSYQKDLIGFRRTLMERIRGEKGVPHFEWGYVTGSGDSIYSAFDYNLYTSEDDFRAIAAAKFDGALWKGETVYYEIVGFTPSGTPIADSLSTKKLYDKDDIDECDPRLTFSYGCSPTGIKRLHGRDDDGYFTLELPAPHLAIYVYRMTLTTEDGQTIDYAPDFMRYRCEQIGVKTAPAFDHFILHDYDLEMDERSAGEIVRDVAEKFYAGSDPIGKTHTREGVVVRIVNRPKFCAYKYKNFEFKVLEEIIKTSAEAPDMEETQK